MAGGLFPNVNLHSMSLGQELGLPEQHSTAQNNLCYAQPRVNMSAGRTEFAQAGATMQLQATSKRRLRELKAMSETEKYRHEIEYLQNAARHFGSYA